MDSKPDEPSLEAIDQTTRAYFRSLGKRITQLRKQHEMTQAELARVLGVPQQSVFSYEQGDRRVPISLVPSLMRALNASCEELLGIKPLQPPPEERMSPRLERHIERIKQLSRTEQRFVFRLAETLLFAR